MGEVFRAEWFETVMIAAVKAMAEEMFAGDAETVRVVAEKEWACPSRGGNSPSVRVFLFVVHVDRETDEEHGEIGEDEGL